MIGIVIVSHSAKLAEGVREFTEQMTQARVPIAAAGGLTDTVLGTSAERIRDAIQQVYREGGVLVLMDLGSAVLSAQMAVDMLPAEQQEHILLSNAPLVEGAFVASVEASLGHELHAVNQAALEARNMEKIL